MDAGLRCPRSCFCLSACACVVVCSVLCVDGSTRIQSLRDAKNKMSKSDPSDYTRINLTDTDQQIVDKVCN